MSHELESRFHAILMIWLILSLANAAFAVSISAMTTEESAILDFLTATPDTCYGRREIARKAMSRSFFEENPHWVDVPLAALVAQGLVECNDGGQFQLYRPDILKR
jgi:hypothetical protein